MTTPASHVRWLCPLLALAALTHEAGAALHVTATVPAGNQLAVPQSTSTVTIFFNTMLSTVPTGAVRVAGMMSGLHPGTVSVADNVVTWQNGARPFFPGELVLIGLRSDITSVAAEPLAGGYHTAFTIASAAAALSWQPRSGFGASDIPYFIHGGDMDGDGDPDVAAPNEATDDVSIFLNDGNGAFPSHGDYGVGDKPSSVFGEDLDNDGDQDLATADINSGTMTVLLNHGDGTLAAGQIHPAGLRCRQVHGADFDGDLDVDLCTTDFDGDRVFIFINHGDGSFDPGMPLTQVADGPFAIRAGDVDADGHVDIAVACQVADSLVVLKNDGNAAFTRTGTYRIADLPWDLAGNDLDGDGDLDYVAVASLANRIVVLLNDGTGGFPTRNLATTGSFPLGVHCADLDGDGDIDATSSNYSGGTVGVYRNDGAGLLTLQATLQCSISGSYAWAHDLDDDGDLDLTVVDENADSLFVFRNGLAAAEAPLPGSAVDALRIEPMPARAGVGARILLAGQGSAPTEVSILDVAGRRVRRLFVPAAARRELLWDGRDEAGRALPAGRYLVRASTAGQAVTRPLVLLP